MAGPGIRSYQFAQELASRLRRHARRPVRRPTSTPTAFRIVVVDPGRRPRTDAALPRADAVVAAAPAGADDAQRSPARDTPVVYDLYAPRTLESAGARRARRRPERALAPAVPSARRSSRRSPSLTGDAFICASERQRDLWLGALAGLGRLDADGYAADPSLRRLIDVVPVRDRPVAEPPHAHARSAASWTGIGERDRVLVWAGGIWELVRPADGDPRRRDPRPIASRRCGSCFLGLGHPEPADRTDGDDRRARSRSPTSSALRDSRGLLQRRVGAVRGPRRVSARGRLGVSAHFDDVETRFAFRTRLLDCVWAGLPVVTTRGDAVGDLLAETRRRPDASPAESVDAWRAALDGTPRRRRGTGGGPRARLAGCASDFVWPRVVEPLAAVLDVRKSDRIATPA